ncbi:Protein kinase domain-containing protein [Psidium guajava]|nr:Protein kinase domain-containing protein [Psidium guajava]
MIGEAEPRSGCWCTMHKTEGKARWLGDRCWRLRLVTRCRACDNGEARTARAIVAMA